jgi:glycosyltransferase involved in cell wall biosynthesis
MLERLARCRMISQVARESKSLANEMSETPVILTLVSSYLPGYKAGGPLRTIANMVDHLSDEFDFWIITRDRDVGDASPYPDIQPNRWQRVGRAMVHYLPPENCTVRDMAELISNTQYDVMYLNSFFGPVFTIKPLLARRLGWLPDKPVVVAPRGEFSAGAIKIKYPKKFAYIQISRLLHLYDHVVWQASSKYELQDIVRVTHVNPAAIQVAINLPSRTSSIAHVKTPLDAKTDGANGTEDATAKIVFLSRISPKKNLDYALRILREVKTNVTFDIYGPTEDADYWKRCTTLMEQLPANVSANYLGSVPSDQVASIFRRYDLFFFPNARRELWTCHCGIAFRGNSCFAEQPNAMARFAGGWNGLGHSAGGRKPIRRRYRRVACDDAKQRPTHAYSTQNGKTFDRPSLASSQSRVVSTCHAKWIK